MKTIPNTVDSKTLAQLADPTDTHAVRLILRQVHNFSPYRMSGKRYKYIFTHDSRIGAHVLDVPLSLWQGDVPKGAYRDNLSICHDLQGNRSTTLPPLVTTIIPLKEGVVEFEKQAQQADPMPAMLETLTGFLRDMDAPDEIMQAMAILTMPGVDAEARKSALTSHIAGVLNTVGYPVDPPQESVIADIDPPEEEPAAKPPATAKQSDEEKKRKAIERAKKSRERKKAKLEAALV